jgi:hypothetical protein
MLPIKITCDYDHTWIGHPLNVVFRVNGRTIHLDVGGKQANSFTKTVKLEEGEHEFCVNIFGKDDTNTLINKSGEVQQDTFIQIKNIEFDGVSINSMINDDDSFAKFYVKDSENIKSKSLIFGENGSLKFTFACPIHTWLLEKLF